jgi:hypothetical protein
MFRIDFLIDHEFSWKVLILLILIYIVFLILIQVKMNFYSQNMKVDD